MKKWISIFVFVLLIMTVMPSTACTSRDIATEVAQSLMQINKGGVEDIDSELSSIDQQLYDTQVRILKLEQVLSPALEWFDYQKTVSKPGNWNISVPQNGLVQFQNDQYQVTALRAVIARDSNTVTQSSYIIKVRDLATMQTDDGDNFHDQLTDSQNILEQNRKAMVDARDLSVSTMHNVLKYVNDWKVKKVSGTTYSVSGPGLGWSGQLTSGAWEYDRGKGTLVPDDQQADNLKTIIIGKLTPQYKVLTSE